VTEATVIREFLANELVGASANDPDEELYQQLMRQLEPADRRSTHVCKLLRLRRRRILWGELPEDTEWWSVAIENSDLDNIRVFSRGKLTGSVGTQLKLKEFAAHVRCGRVSDHSGEIRRVHELAELFLRGEQQTSILLVGTSENTLTVLDGNHRLIAALLVAPELISKRFRFFCGLSPQMDRCVWHQNNLLNFCRYARRRLRFLFAPSFSRFAFHALAPECKSNSLSEEPHKGQS
jgi:hypothetical protein